MIRSLVLPCGLVLNALTAVAISPMTQQRLGFHHLKRVTFMLTFVWPDCSGFRLT